MLSIMAFPEECVILNLIEIFQFCIKRYGKKLKEDENMESSKVFVLGQKISLKFLAKFGKILVI
jgi:hypothetical protein